MASTSSNTSIGDGRDVQVEETNNRSRSKGKRKVKRSTNKATVDSKPIRTSNKAITEAKPIKVRILTSGRIATISIRRDHIEKREREMKATAKSAQSHCGNWNGSLLYGRLQEQVQWRASMNSASDSRAEEIHVEPPQEIQDVWEPSTTKLLQEYYRSGRVEIDDDSSGKDILMVLGYFGILYRPNQVDFGNFACYMRVKMWNDYFSYRKSMVNYIVERCYRQSKLSNLFLTTEEPTEASTFFYVRGKKCEVFDGGLTVRDPTELSCSVVHEFFNDEDENEGSFAGQARQDFCSYLEKSLQGTHITFEVCDVSMRDPTTSALQPAGRKAVLFVRCQPKTQAANQLAPVEMTVNSSNVHGEEHSEIEPVTPHADMPQLELIHKDMAHPETKNPHMDNVNAHPAHVKTPHVIAPDTAALETPVPEKPVETIPNPETPTLHTQAERSHLVRLSELETPNTPLFFQDKMANEVNECNIIPVQTDSRLIHMRENERAAGTSPWIPREEVVTVTQHGYTDAYETPVKLINAHGHTVTPSSAEMNFNSNKPSQHHWVPASSECTIVSEDSSFLLPISQKQATQKKNTPKGSIEDNNAKWLSEMFSFGRGESGIFKCLD